MLEMLASLNPNAETKPFWDWCAKRELRFQRCVACGTFRFPPLTGCRHCAATEAEWVRVSVRARVFSYTIVANPALPDLRHDVPYNVVVVEFDDAPGARLVSNVVGIAPEDVRVGMELDLVFEEPAPGVVLPRFRPARLGGA
ncbi:MAG: Zn-ribbon domain-containing OB-fold protein [Candidatus Binatia bacterium]